MKKYRVKKIFGPTLQGEGTHSGRVVKFLRLAGCNRWNGLPDAKKDAVCYFCDTDFRDGTPLDAETILDQLNALGPVRTVVISGGEPTLQIDAPLLSLLIRAGYDLHLETNGSKALGPLHQYFEHITMSPKQSLSATALERCHDLKLLYPPIAEDITLEVFNQFPAKQRWLQPLELSGNMDLSIKATLPKLMANPSWRLSLQTHKIIGVE